MASSQYRTPPSRRLVRLSRPYDFVYDSAYTTPSRADFLKDSALGARSGARMKLKPVYESMFSELKSDRRLEACLSPMKPNVLDSFLPQYSVNGSPIMPCDTGPNPLPREVDDVTGANRAKYAIRYDQPSYHMEKKTFDFNKLRPDEKKKILQTQRTRRIGYVNRSVQTDIRDSEVQTDPYSPPYTLPETESSPKVLALMQMTWGKGLPFTLDDIVTIERVLTRRMLEHTNRSADDPAGFEARIKLMEELEAQQWADRERELEKLQNMKMEIVSKLLLEYSTHIANDHTMRLERLQENLRDKSVKHLENVKTEYFRSLRKLEKKYFSEKESRKRNIIKDYTTFDSAIYAPLVRNGVAIDLLNPVPPFQIDIHRDYDSFEKLTHSRKFIRKELAFDMHAFKNRIQKCEATSYDKRMEKKLEAVLAAFKEHHSGFRKSNQLLDMVKENDALNQPRPSMTPVIQTEDDTETGQRRRHCITIQKVARGRVIQKLIRNEIEENMNELLGMKMMFDMDPNCQRVAEGQMQKLIAMKKQSEADANKDAAVKEVVGHLEGETLNKMLDFLDKEMIRLIDERKIHALILLAERERRRKEAIEAGRRYQEEERRRTMDEMFKHVVGITQATVDIFLEEMYIESSDRTADEMSRNHVRQMAATINEAAYAIPAADITQYEHEEYAAELFSSFMIPELCRVLHQDQLAAAAKRYTKAAGEIVDAVISSHAVAKEIVDMYVPPLVTEHNIKGWAAADGSVSYLDGLIREAVDEALVRKQAQEEADSRRVPEIQAIPDINVTPAAASPEDSTAIEVVQAPHSDAFEQEDEEEEIKVAEEDDEEEQEEQAEETQEIRKSRIKQSVVLADIVTTIPEPVAESSDQLQPGEPDNRVFYEPQLLVYDEVKQSLAAKSLQLALGTEPGQNVVDIFDGAKEMMDDIFSETQRLLVPQQDKGVDSEDTMSGDTDDED